MDLSGIVELIGHEMTTIRDDDEGRNGIHDGGFSVQSATNVPCPVGFALGRVSGLRGLGCMAYAGSMPSHAISPNGLNAGWLAAKSPEGACDVGRSMQSDLQNAST